MCLHKEDRHTSEGEGLNAAAEFLSFANLSVLPWKSSATCNRRDNPSPKVSGAHVCARAR